MNSFFLCPRFTCCRGWRRDGDRCRCVLPLPLPIVYHSTTCSINSLIFIINGYDVITLFWLQPVLLLPLVQRYIPPAKLPFLYIHNNIILVPAAILVLLPSALSSSAPFSRRLPLFSSRRLPLPPVKMPRQPPTMPRLSKSESSTSTVSDRTGC